MKTETYSSDSWLELNQIPPWLAIKWKEKYLHLMYSTELYYATQYSMPDAIEKVEWVANEYALARIKGTI